MIGDVINEAKLDAEIINSKMQQYEKELFDIAQENSGKLMGEQETEVIQETFLDGNVKAQNLIKSEWAAAGNKWSILFLISANTLTIYNVFRDLI